MSNKHFYWFSTRETTRALHLLDSSVGSLRSPLQVCCSVDVTPSTTFFRVSPSIEKTHQPYAITVFFAGLELFRRESFTFSEPVGKTKIRRTDTARRAAEHFPHYDRGHRRISRCFCQTHIIIQFYTIITSGSSPARTSPDSEDHPTDQHQNRVHRQSYILISYTL
jgi:hypothetical protein